MPRPAAACRRLVVAIALAIGLGAVLQPRAVGDDDLAAQLPRIAPTEPAEAQRALKVQPGFRAGLAAAEPLVADPVAACYDADGRLYVVEMRGYPFPEKEPTGSVRLLVDDDHDGRFDRATEFLTGLNWPTGVVPYDGGVYVAAAPDLLYAKDTDGDGVADVNKVAFTGFGTQNVQQLVNGLCWGLDGWIYGAAAGNGGEVRDPSRPDRKPLTLRGRDFRFRPDGSAIEAESGGGQFGNVFDDWGHRFVCNNRWHARQVVLPARYVARNPEVAVTGVIADIASDGNEARVFRVSPPEPWRVVRSKQYEAKMKTDPVFARRLPNAERHPAGFFSSASGMTVYRGTAFPPEFRGNAFVCDVAGNLVHRKTLTRDGAAFRADRAGPKTPAEFLASPDVWFRPVNLLNTPDGTLLVLDMYRETIEHPLSIPDDIKAHLDLTSGRTRGRVYHVAPEGFRPRERPALSKASVPELVRRLDDRDAWWRETAQRLLLERGAASRDEIARALREFLASGPSPLGRLHALWTLDDLGRSDEALVREAFRSPEPGLRENAAVLAEAHVAEWPSLAAEVIRLADDPDAMVRFQAALSLGSVTEPAAVEALATVARKDAADRWTRTAVLLSSKGRTLALAKALAKSPAFFAGEPGRAWLEEVAAVVGASKDGAAPRELLALFTGPDADPAAARATLVGLARGAQRAGRNADALFRGEAAARLAPLMERAAARAADPDRPPAERVEAVRLLTLGPAEKTLATLPPLLDGREPPDVQVEALRALNGLNDPKVAAAVVEAWRSLSPAVRREAAEVLLARPERVAALLDALEARTLNAGDLDPLRRKQLTEHPRADLRGRARALLAGEASGDRAAVVAAFRPALGLAGEASRGRTVYKASCATCHRAGGEGVEVGPNFETVAAKPPEELLVHVLDPNREVAPGFVNYNVATRDGRVASGLVAEETVAAVTLKRAEGVTETIPRARIEAVQATGLSLMPEGLEKALRPQDLADLFAFIRALPAAPPR